MSSSEPDVRIRVGDVDCSSGTLRALADWEIARAERRRAVERSARLRRNAIRLLVLDGGSLRAIARLVDVSYQRVGQIVADLRNNHELPSTMVSEQESPNGNV